MLGTPKVSDSYARSSVRVLPAALAGPSVSYALSVSDFCVFFELSLLVFALALSFCLYTLPLSDSFAHILTTILLLLA